MTTDKLIRLVLPWPPSVNAAWRHTSTGGKVHTYLTDKQKKYRLAVCLFALRDRCRHKVPDIVSVTISLYPPTKHRRDIDNHVKAILDALTAAGVWLDDSQVDELHVYRRDQVKGGRAVVDVLPL